jgi:hypothetical protein
LTKQRLEMRGDKEALRQRLNLPREKSIIFLGEKAAVLAELCQEMGMFTVHPLDIPSNQRGRGVRLLEVRMHDRGEE